MTDKLLELQSELKDIDLSLKQGVETLRAVAEKMERKHDDPEEPDLHLLADCYQAQQRKVAECVARIAAMRQTERLEVSMMQRMLDNPAWRTEPAA